MSWIYDGQVGIKAWISGKERETARVHKWVSNIYGMKMVKMVIEIYFLE